MAHIKSFCLIIFAIITQIASAQYYGYSIDNFQIHQYACLEKGRKIIVYRHRNPYDLCYNHNKCFNTLVTSCKMNEDTTVVILRCSDDIMGGCHFLEGKDLDSTTLCVCEECGRISVGKDSVLVSLYHPLSGVVIFDPIKLEQIKGTKYHNGSSIYVFLKKNIMEAKHVASNNCSLYCAIPNTDFPCYLYVTNPNYQVSELIEIIIGDVSLPSEPTNH